MTLFQIIRQYFGVPRHRVLVDPRPPCKSCELLRHQNRAVEKKLLEVQQARARQMLALTAAEEGTQHAHDAAAVLEEQNQQLGHDLEALLKLARLARQVERHEREGDRAAGVLALAQLRAHLNVIAPLLPAEKDLQP